jgi:large subunit ribosomal protein L10
MARPEKAAAVAELSEQFTQSAGAVLTEYRGLTVHQLQELRRVLGDNATYAVVKNTLTKIAARDAGIEGLDDLLTGPSAIAFITGDVVEAAKGLRDFAKANQPLVVKGGVLDGKPVSVDEISRMADLESREVLLAKFAGALQASLTNAAYMFNAPASQLARVLGALQAKAEEDPTILAAGAPAASEAPSEAPSDATSEAPVEASADATAEAPADATAEAPADAPSDAEAPADATAEAPADAPSDAEAPAEADPQNPDADEASSISMGIS